MWESRRASPRPTPHPDPTFQGGGVPKLGPEESVKRFVKGLAEQGNRRSRDPGGLDPIP
jgi:hypothetical protein